MLKNVPPFGRSEVKVERVYVNSKDEWRIKIP